MSKIKTEFSLNSFLWISKWCCLALFSIISVFFRSLIKFRIFSGDFHEKTFLPGKEGKPCRDCVGRVRVGWSQCGSSGGNGRFVTCLDHPTPTNPCHHHHTNHMHSFFVNCMGKKVNGLVQKPEDKIGRPSIHSIHYWLGFGCDHVDTVSSHCLIPCTFSPNNLNGSNVADCFVSVCLLPNTKWCQAYAPSFRAKIDHAIASAHYLPRGPIRQKRLQVLHRLLQR